MRPIVTAGGQHKDVDQKCRKGDEPQDGKDNYHSVTSDLMNWTVFFMPFSQTY